VELVDPAGLAKKMKIVTSVRTKRAGNIDALRSFGKRKPASRQIFRIVAALLGVESDRGDYNCWLRRIAYCLSRGFHYREHSNCGYHLDGGRKSRPEIAITKFVMTQCNPVSLAVGP